VKYLILVAVLLVSAGCQKQTAYYKGHEVEIVKESCNVKPCRSVIRYQSGLTSEVKSSELIK
jgi:hypothetical protein